MSKTSIKPGVSLLGLSVPMAFAWVIARSVYSEYGESLTLTSGSDSHHGRGSRHYVGNALDLRTRSITDTHTKRAIATDLGKQLGPEFDVVLEAIGEPNEHIHIEWDPK